MNELWKDIGALAALAERALLVWAKWIESMRTDAERAHHCGELLAAYHRRSS
jgi:hypothetical protein